MSVYVFQNDEVPIFITHFLSYFTYCVTSVYYIIYYTVLYLKYCSMSKYKYEYKDVPDIVHEHDNIVLLPLLFMAMTVPEVIFT